MRWLRWLAAAVAVVVVLVVAAGVYVATLDLNAYKGEIQSALEDAVGRTVEINGPLHLTWTPRPGVTASDVRIANAEWGSEPAMATVGDLAVGVELRPLLLGKIEVYRLRLSDARLLLERGPDGQGNWAAGGPGDDGTAGGGAGGEPSIKRFELTNSRIVWKPAPDAEEQVYRIDTLRLDGAGLTAPLDIELTADLQGAPLVLKGSVPALSIVGQAGGTGPVDVEGAFSGTPVALAAELRVERAANGTFNRINADRLKLSYGELAAGGSGAVDLTGGVPRVELQLQAETVDLSPYVGGDAKDGGDVMQRPLPVGLLPPFDGTADMRIARIVAGRWTVEEVSATATLEQGVLTLDPVKGRVADGSASLRGELDTRESPARLTLTAAGERLDMAKVYRALTDQALIQGTGEAALDLRATGNTPNELVGSVNGFTRLIVRDGVILNRYWELIAADLTTQFMPFTKDSDRSNLNCFVSRFDIESGTADASVLLVDTDRVLVGGEGTVDLAGRTLDMRLVPQPKDPALISLATPILLKGPISDPQPSPDPIAVAKGLGAIAAGAMIGPLAVLLPFVSGGSADNACPDAIAAARGERRPSGQGSSGKQDNSGGIKGLFEDLRKAIE